MDARTREQGFTVIEILAVVGIFGLLAAIAAPETARTLNDLRLRGDARSIQNMVGLAKMRAAARFSKERVYVDLTTKSFQLQYWDKTAGDWASEGGSTFLSTNVEFDYGTLTGPPPDTQSSLAQAPACLTAANAPIANTACVVFNSRGIPVDSAGAPTGNTAFYVTDGTGIYGVTVSATPLVRLWWSPASQMSWLHK